MPSQYILDILTDFELEAENDALLISRSDLDKFVFGDDCDSQVDHFAFAAPESPSAPLLTTEAPAQADVPNMDGLLLNALSFSEGWEAGVL